MSGMRVESGEVETERSVHSSEERLSNPVIWLLNSKGGEVVQACLTLCDTMDCSPPGSSVHGIIQARILEWVSMAFSRGSLPKCAIPSEPGTSVSSCLYRALALKSTLFSSALIFSCCCSLTKSYLTLCDPMDYSKPGSSVTDCLPEFAHIHVH